MSVRCRCSTSTSLAGVETSRLVRMYEYPYRGVEFAIGVKRNTAVVRASRTAPAAG